MNTNEVGRRAQETANLIWNAATSLFGAFKPRDYGLVILPMCVIKRFHDCLLPTYNAVLSANKGLEELDESREILLKEASGYPFYNTSHFSFSKLLGDPLNIKENFSGYLAGFSDNVQQILAHMDFHIQVDRMADTGVLYQILLDFNALDMSPNRITTVDMGYIFENLVMRFSEAYNEDAGSHFTSRDINYLMCDLLLANNDITKDIKGKTCSVYDMAMGTSQMLTCMEERIKQFNANASIQTFGQELNPFTLGIAVADALIRGSDPNNFKFGDTLSDDKFSGCEFDFVISNPPFGIDWKREALAVEAEHKTGAAGRFAAGLPSKSDGQMLFILNGVSKLKDTGCMAIIQSGSSLSIGDAESGQSSIRRYLIENDLLDAIVQLPSNSFYNTSIATYIWIISKNKPQDRRGKIQLIDASKCSFSRRKPIGKKKYDISDACRKMILQAYGEYSNKAYAGISEDGKPIVCKSEILDGISLGYSKVIVETPIYTEDGTPLLRRGKKVADTTKRTVERIPLTEGIDDYITREVLPYNPDAWIDGRKTKIGYTIPFAQVFCEYTALESSTEIAARIIEREQRLEEMLRTLFNKGV